MWRGGGCGGGEEKPGFGEPLEQQVIAKESTQLAIEPIPGLLNTRFVKTSGLEIESLWLLMRGSRHYYMFHHYAPSLIATSFSCSDRLTKYPIIRRSTSISKLWNRYLVSAPLSLNS